MTEYTLVEPAPHEFRGHLNFDGLELYFALHRQIYRAHDWDGPKPTEVWIGGDRWTGAWTYQRGGIKPPSKPLPSGTEIAFETIREFRLHLEHPDNSLKSVNFHFRPRWPGQTSKTGKTINQPDGLGEAVNVRIDGSNIEFEKYHEIVRQAIAAEGINERYVQEPHAYSNVQNAEVYVRIDREASEPLHARDGTLARLFHVLEQDRSGYRRLVQDDGPIAGYYHTVGLDPYRIQEVWGDHHLAKVFKHYHPRKVHDDENDPLYHPKLGVRFDADHTEETVHWDDLDQLVDELEDALFSCLVDVDLERSASDSFPFVADDVFGASLREVDRVVQLDLSDIQITQESIVVSALADGLSPVGEESISSLVSNGAMAPTEIADEHDRHPDSVRRALRRLEGLVRREYGSAVLESPHIAQLLHDAVADAREHVRRAVDSTGTALSAATRGLTEAEARLRVWAKRYGVNLQRISQSAGELVIDTETKPDAWAALAEGLDLWTDARGSPVPFTVEADHYWQRSDGGRDRITLHNVLAVRHR